MTSLPWKTHTTVVLCGSDGPLWTSGMRWIRLRMNETADGLTVLRQYPPWDVDLFFRVSGVLCVRSVRFTANCTLYLFKQNGNNMSFTQGATHTSNQDDGYDLTDTRGASQNSTKQKMTPFFPQISVRLAEKKRKVLKMLHKFFLSVDGEEQQRVTVLGCFTNNTKKAKK